MKKNFRFAFAFIIFAISFSCTSISSNLIDHQYIVEKLIQTDGLDLNQVTQINILLEDSIYDDFLPKSLPSKPEGKINMVFFGRVEKEKNIKLIVETVSLLQKQFHNVSLTIIGNGHPSYIAEMKNLMKEKLQDSTYTYIAGCPHNKLREHLSDKHFYIFPSEQMYEGHSNAVTEAMAYGIVPIASPQGFSRTVIGNDELIVDEFSADEYAERIANIIREERFDEISASLYDRVCSNYTSSIVRKQIGLVYSGLTHCN